MSAIEYFAKPVTLTATTDGGYDADGFAASNSTAPSTIQAVIQPVSDADLKDAPEGIREEARKAMWTRASVSENDQITEGSLTYRVLSVRNWRDHNKALLGMVEE